MNAVLEIAASNVVLSALLAIVTLAVTRVWRSPQLAHGLWLLVLLKLVTPPLVSVSGPSAWLDQFESAQSSPPVTSGADNTASSANDEAVLQSAPEPAIGPSAVASNVELPQRPATVALDEPPVPIKHSEPIDTPARADSAAELTIIPWPAAVAYVWLAGAIVYIVVLVLRCIGFRHVLSESTAAGANITESVGHLAAKLGLRRFPPVRMVEATAPPLVWSLGFRPLIVLPAKLLAELSPAQRDALIAHELAHIRRRDDLVRWLEVIALVAFWWNPVAWFARRRLREAEEECCDAWVVWALPGERRSYGEAMLATIEFLAGGPKLPALAGSTFGGSFCKRRIEMIMKRNVDRRISWAALGTLLVAAGVLPVVAQSNSLEGGNRLSQSDASAPSADSITREVQPEENVGVTTDAAAVETSSDAAAGAPSSGAVESADDPQNAKVPRTDATAVDNGEDARPMAIMQKLIDRVERLLQEQSDLRGAANMGRPLTASPRFSLASISSDKREQDLQLKLLNLDVAAAKADIEPARLKWRKSTEANKKQPGTVSDVEIELQRAEYEQKLVQLQRAETLFELYKRQVERKWEEAARQDETLESAARTRSRQLASAQQRAMRTDELAQLKELNERIGKEITRLEHLLKVEPDSPETWRAVEDFWRAYRRLSASAAKTEDMRSRPYEGGKK